MLPILALVAGLLVAPRPGRAQDRLAPPDSVIAVDSSAVITVPDTASAVRRAPVPARLFDQPRFVMLRSVLVPGWGQLHNRAWIKAVAVAGTEGYLISRIVSDSRDLRTLNDAVDAARANGDFEAENEAVDRYNVRLDRYVGRQWLLGALVIYSMVDAYVDAQFVHFKVEFENDPARPAGVRLGLEKRF